MPDGGVQSDREDWDKDIEVSTAAAGAGGDAGGVGGKIRFAVLRGGDLREGRCGSGGQRAGRERVCFEKTTVGNNRALEFAKERGLLRPNSFVVLTAGLPKAGANTNLFSIIKID